MQLVFVLGLSPSGTLSSFFRDSARCLVLARVRLGPAELQHGRPTAPLRGRASAGLAISAAFFHCRKSNTASHLFTAGSPWPRGQGWPSGLEDRPHSPRARKQAACAVSPKMQAQLRDGLSAIETVFRLIKNSYSFNWATSFQTWRRRPFFGLCRYRKKADFRTYR